MTINQPEFQKDNSIAGDRALAVHVNQQDYVFSTYNYGDIDNNKAEVAVERPFTYGQNKGDWTFFYFGYSFEKKEAYSFVRYYESEDSYVFKKTNHYVASYLSFFLGFDRFSTRFTVIHIS